MAQRSWGGLRAGRALVAHAAPQHQHLAISRFIAELHIRSHPFGLALLQPRFRSARTRSSDDPVALGALAARCRRWIRGTVVQCLRTLRTFGCSPPRGFLHRKEASDLVGPPCFVPGDPKEGGRIR
jgi:hypothetical protein